MPGFRCDKTEVFPFRKELKELLCFLFVDIVFNTNPSENWSILLCPLGKSRREKGIKTKHWIREKVIFWLDLKAQTRPQRCTDSSNNTAKIHFSSYLLYSPPQKPRNVHIICALNWKEHKFKILKRSLINCYKMNWCVSCAERHNTGKQSEEKCVQVLDI